jgi:high-affinity iron transporter
MASVPPNRELRQLGRTALVMVAAIATSAVLIWQGITASGNPIPTPGKTLPEAALDIAVLVSREGLECILVLAVLIAGLKERDYGYKRPIQLGAALGFLSLIATWSVAITIVGDLAANYGVLSVQAAVGMFAVIVILVEMDWFFHGIYWSDWIRMQNRTKRSLISEAKQLGRSSRRILLGLVVLGFVSVYREGFEVVLFLQSFYLEMGPTVVYYGAAAGLVMTLAIGYLTFLGQRRLPYKTMLVTTGVILTGVVFVMVGEEVNEMQLAGWIGTTNIPWLQGTPAWAQLWFSIYPNVQTFVAQGFALLTIGGSFVFIRLRLRKTIQNSKKKNDDGSKLMEKDMAFVAPGPH